MAEAARDTMADAVGRTLRPAEPETDVSLVEAFRKGDRAAFESLVRRHQSVVFTVVRRFVRDHAAAEDVAQRAFITAYERIGELRGTFRPWLLQIAVNLAKNHLRDGGRLVPSEHLPERPSEVPDAGEALDRHRLGARLRAALVKLPNRQREVALLRVDGQLSFAEIARTLGITENNAKVTYHLATRRLRAELGGTDDAA